MKRFFAAVFALTMLFSTPAFASDFGMTSESFLRLFGYASSKVQRGISGMSIKSSYRKTETGCAVEYDSSIILVINENVNENIRNLAVIYVPDSEESNTRYMKGGPPPTEAVFENVCMQVIFTLNSDMSERTVRDVLTEIGLYGRSIDGVQRSRVVGKHNYIMKMQPNGMLIMAVSHI